MYSGQSRKKDSYRQDITASLTGTSLCTYAIEPPCTERYARWCERSGLFRPLLLDFIIGRRASGVDQTVKFHKNPGAFLERVTRLTIVKSDILRYYVLIGSLILILDSNIESRIPCATHTRIVRMHAAPSHAESDAPLAL